MDPFTQPQQWLGVSSWGFTKLNELFNGRVAMLGFALSVVAELSQHRGPIAQVCFPRSMHHAGVPRERCVHVHSCESLCLYAS
jgi:hypothetical protein